MAVMSGCSFAKVRQKLLRAALNMRRLLQFRLPLGTLGHPLARTVSAPASQISYGRPGRREDDLPFRLLQVWQSRLDYAEQGEKVDVE